MSHYFSYAINPKTGEAEKAEFIDDYFGKHEYGVRFPSTGEVHHIEDIFTTEEAPTIVNFRKDFKKREGASFIKKMYTQYKIEDKNGYVIYATIYEPDKRITLTPHHQKDKFEFKDMSKESWEALLNLLNKTTDIIEEK